MTAILMQEGCIPVWIDPTLVCVVFSAAVWKARSRDVHCPKLQLDMYYNGFCNSVLWQLFHYVPLNIDSWQKMSEQRAMQMQWQAYQVQCSHPNC